MLQTEAKMDDRLGDGAKEVRLETTETPNVDYDSTVSTMHTTKKTNIFTDYGEVFQITKHGRTVAEIRPPSPQPNLPRRGMARGSGFWMADDFDEPL